MMWSNVGIGWGGWVVMTVAMVALWAVVVFVLMTLFSTEKPARQRTAQPQDRSDGQVLDERFARGEINAAEYQARRAGLSSER